MLVFKDFLTDDEVCTDVYPCEMVGKNKTIMKITAKRKTESNSISDAAIGGNPSAEEAAEGAEDGAVTGIDVIMDNRLAEINGYSLKEYKKHLKEYLKKLMAAKSKRVEELKEENRTAEAEKMQEENKSFQKNFQEDVTEVIFTNFKEKEYQFFVGESISMENCMVILMCYVGEDPNPSIFFIRHGLAEMKV